MKTKMLFLLLAGCLLGLAAWFVSVPNPAQADEVPEKYHETVHKGLEYLVKSQHKDGHWEGDDGKHPVAMTGLVGVALLMERKPPSPGRGYEGRPVGDKAKYQANIRKAADWLMDKSQAGRDGLIFSEHASESARYMQGQGLATLFLAGACKDEDDAGRRKKLNEVLTRAVKYIVKAQSSQGGWYHTSKVEGHDFDTMSATVIQIQALHAAENAGIPVPGVPLGDAQEYLKMASEKIAKGAKTGSADTAGALVCRYTAHGAKDEWCKKWLKKCQTDIPWTPAGGSQIDRDELAHFYYAQALFNLYENRSEDDVVWTGYRTAKFDHLQSTQNKDGSWPTPLASTEAFGVGPVYATAVWCTILQLDKRSHPAMRPRVVIRL